MFDYKPSRLIHVQRLPSNFPFFLFSGYAFTHLTSVCSICFRWSCYVLHFFPLFIALSPFPKNVDPRISVFLLQIPLPGMDDTPYAMQQHVFSFLIFTANIVDCGILLMRFTPSFFRSKQATFLVTSKFSESPGHARRGVLHESSLPGPGIKFAQTGNVLTLSFASPLVAYRFTDLTLLRSWCCCPHIMVPLRATGAFQAKQHIAAATTLHSLFTTSLLPSNRRRHLPAAFPSNSLFLSEEALLYITHTLVFVQV